MSALDRKAVRLALGALDWLAIAFTAFIAASLLAMGLAAADAIAPMLLGLLAPALGLFALKSGRRNRAVLVATLAANVLVLPCVMYWAESIGEDRGGFAALLIVVWVVTPLANVWLAATRWSALRSAGAAT